MAATMSARRKWRWTSEGTFLGLRIQTLANMGAYLSTFAPCVPTYLYATLLAGIYKTPVIYCEVKAVFTNTVPVDAYRGAGRPEATFLLERLVDVIAHDTGIDRWNCGGRTSSPPMRSRTRRRSRCNMTAATTRRRCGSR